MYYTDEEIEEIATEMNCSIEEVKYELEIMFECAITELDEEDFGVAW